MHLSCQTEPDVLYAAHKPPVQQEAGTESALGFIQASWTLSLSVFAPRCDRDQQSVLTASAPLLTANEMPPDRGAFPAR